MRKFIFLFLIIFPSCGNYDFENASQSIDKGDYDSAIEICKERVKENHLDFRFYRLLIIALMNKKEYEESYYYAKRLSKLDNKNQFSFYAKAEALRQMKKNNKAWKDISKAISLAPDESPSIILDMAEEYQEKDDFTVDIRELRFLRGYIGANLPKEYETSFRDFSFCILMNYEMVESYLQRGVLSSMSDNMKEEGCKDLNMADFYGHKDAPSLIKKYCQ